MPTPSSFLDEIVPRWEQRGSDLRKEVRFQKDTFESHQMALMGLRLATREQRQRDLRELDGLAATSRLSGVRQLDAVVDLLPPVRALHAKLSAVEEAMQAVTWGHRAAQHQDSISRRLEHHAQALQKERSVLHAELEAWSQLLQERLVPLREFKEKETAKGERIYVSRARKQPETDFVMQQREREEELKERLYRLRQSLNHAVGRLHKMAWTVDQRTQRSSNGVQELRDSLQQRLRQLQKLYDERRDEVLADALLFEAGRRHLQSAQEYVRGMRCVEDSTPAMMMKKSVWAKFRSN